MSEHQFLNEKCPKMTVRALWVQRSRACSILEIEVDFRATIDAAAIGVVFTGCFDIGTSWFGKTFGGCRDLLWADG